MKATNTKAIKIYPTSIIPQGSKIEPLRDHKLIASSMSIEVLHIAVFVAVIAFIFGGLWKSATRTTSKATSPELAEVTA
jgi:hypothetical protein